MVQHKESEPVFCNNYKWSVTIKNCELWYGTL